MLLSMALLATDAASMDRQRFATGSVPEFNAVTPS
jgi:hypothetical protein